MSDSENDIDYEELLKTLNEKNIYLQRQEQNTELREKYEESFRKYAEFRNEFINYKDDFEINQIQMFNSFKFFKDSRNLYTTQVMKLEEFQKKSEALMKKSLDQQAEFDTMVKNWNNKINDLSISLDEESQLLQIQTGESKVDSLHKEIEIILNSHIEEDRKSRNCPMHNSYLKEEKQLTDQLMKETKDYEENLKNCNELEIEINEYGAIIGDIQKQLH